MKKRILSTTWALLLFVLSGCMPLHVDPAGVNVRNREAETPTVATEQQVQSAPVAEGDAPAENRGADGVGDPLFPQSGNGGYDVQHYDLALL